MNPDTDIFFRFYCTLGIEKSRILERFLIDELDYNFLEKAET